MATRSRVESPDSARSERTIERTEHPHIVRDSGIASGRPIIEGSRIRVELIAGFHLSGTDPGEILATYPHLKPAAVYDAISYYLDHQDKIDRAVEASIPQDVRDRYGLEVEGAKIVSRDP